MLIWQQEDRSTWRLFVDTIAIHLYTDDAGGTYRLYTSRNDQLITFPANGSEHAKKKALKLVLEGLRVERDRILTIADKILTALD